MTPRRKRHCVSYGAPLALACCLAIGLLRSPTADAQQVTDDQLVRFGTELAAHVNAHDGDALAGLFTPDDITCPGPDPNATSNVCSGRAPGTVVQGYWVGPLYSELGAVDSTGLLAEVNLGLDRVPAPGSLTTTARQAPFPFLRARCPDCGTVVLAGTVPPAGGQPTLLFSVRSTPGGMRLFAVTRGEILQPDERVYVTGGTHYDGTQFIRPGTQWPAPTELRLEQSVEVTNPDGSFIPPERRQAVSSLTWSAVPGFAGAYVLERARAPYGSTEPRQWEAFANVAGTWFVEEPYPFLDLLAYQRCYRVATVVDGQTGAYSTEVCTAVPPSSGPEPAGEPPFNFDEVKEVVVPLIGDDGRTHYVTLLEDTRGIVRIRLSLFDFSPLSYNVVIFRRGDCSETANYGPDDVIRPNFSFTLDSRATLVLQFFNTDSITLLPGPKSIYDADGTSLAVYRPGSGGSGLLAACAVLSAPPGAPDTGTGATTADEAPIDYQGVGVIAAGFGLVAASALLAWHRRAVRA